MSEVSTYELVKPKTRSFVRPIAIDGIPGAYAPLKIFPSGQCRLYRIQKEGKVFAKCGSLANRGIPVSV